MVVEKGWNDIDHVLVESVVEYDELSRQRVGTVVGSGLAVLELLGFSEEEVLHPVHVLQDWNVAVFEVLGIETPLYRLY